MTYCLAICTIREQERLIQQEERVGIPTAERRRNLIVFKIAIVALAYTTIAITYVQSMNYAADSCESASRASSSYTITNCNVTYIAPNGTTIDADLPSVDEASGLLCNTAYSVVGLGASLAGVLGSVTTMAVATTARKCRRAYRGEDTMNGKCCSTTAKTVLFLAGSALSTYWLMQRFNYGAEQCEDAGSLYSGYNFTGCDITYTFQDGYVTNTTASDLTQAPEYFCNSASRISGFASGLMGYCTIAIAPGLALLGEGIRQAYLRPRL